MQAGNSQDNLTLRNIGFLHGEQVVSAGGAEGIPPVSAPAEGMCCCRNSGGKEWPSSLARADRTRELAKALGTSMMTIQRDLKVLEQQNFCKPPGVGRATQFQVHDIPIAIRLPTACSPPSRPLPVRRPNWCRRKPAAGRWHHHPGAGAPVGRAAAYCGYQRPHKCPCAPPPNLLCT